MLLIDGVKYELWTPPSEDEFEQVVKEHTQEIFGEQSIYLDRKQKLRSLSGISSIPDGYVIVLGGPPQWHIIEIELSSHPLHDHIVSQIGRFISGISNTNIQRGIVNAVDEEIARDDFIKFTLRKAIEPTEIYKFLSDLISMPPVLTIIIEKRTGELEEALATLRYPQIKVVEFQTFRRVEAEAVHAHLFEPLVKEVKPMSVPTPQLSVSPVRPPVPPLPLGSNIEVILSGGVTWRKYHLIYFGAKNRPFFPGYKVLFQVETDKGNIPTWVASTTKGGKRGGTEKVGDAEAGMFIQKNMKPWFDAHPELKVGDRLRISVIEPMKKYRLEIVK